MLHNTKRLFRSTTVVANIFQQLITILLVRVVTRPANMRRPIANTITGVSFGKRRLRNEHLTILSEEISMKSIIRKMSEDVTWAVVKTAPLLRGETKTDLLLTRETTNGPWDK